MLRGDLGAVAAAALSGGAAGAGAVPARGRPAGAADAGADRPDSVDAALAKIGAGRRGVEARRRPDPGAPRRRPSRRLHPQPGRHHRAGARGGRGGARAAGDRRGARRRGDRAAPGRAAAAVPGDRVAGSAAAGDAGRAAGGRPRCRRSLFDLLHLDGADLLDAARGGRGPRRWPRCVPAELRVPRRGDRLGRRRRRRRSPAALDRGHEGVVVKSLDAPYEAGRRGAGWLKVKPRHTLDLVVLAVEWGHGRRQPAGCPTCTWAPATRRPAGS